MVALLTVTLLVLSAFVADFGQAYVSKRQLQVASDAAALAAASAYANAPGTCATLAADTDLRTTAQGLADSYRLRNRPGSTADPAAIDVQCVSGALRVTVGSVGSTSTAFAPVMGGPSSIATRRTATAALEVANSVASGLRPLAICSADLPDGGVVTGHVVKITAPGDGQGPAAGCPQPPNPGNWWTLDCPEDRVGGTSKLELTIRNGCSDTVSIIDTTAATTSAERQSLLIAACPSAPLHSETCLSGDPGSPDAGQIEDAWGHLIDNRVAVTLPVFCGRTDCAGSTVTGNGTNAIFPVYKLAGMVVCGYHFGKQANKQYQPDTNPACAIDNPGDAPHVAPNDNDQNYLLVVFTRVQVSGGTKPAMCQLGDATCDTGPRRVRLVD